MEPHKTAAGSHALYDRAASRKPTRLSLNSDLLEKAHASLGVDLTSTVETALASEVYRRQQAAWLAENREAIETYNALVAHDGVFSHGLRGF